MSLRHKTTCAVGAYKKDCDIRIFAYVIILVKSIITRSVCFANNYQLKILHLVNIYYCRTVNTVRAKLLEPNQI